MTSNLPKISNLSSRVIRVLGCNPSPMTLQGTNTYVIGTGEKRILLDTGEGGTKEYIQLLQSVLEKYKCKLQTIIVSHWHHDHIGGVEDILKEIKPDCHLQKLPRCDTSLRNSEEGYEYVTDGDIISTEGATLKVVATPGHTDDHLSLFLEEESALFSGDCILGEGTAVFEDLYNYMNSLQKMLTFKPSVIYPGHGPVVPNPLEKITDYIKHRMQREKQIIECLQRAKPNPLAVGEIVSTIYCDVPKHLHPAAAVNVLQHLKKLLKENIIGELKSGTSNSAKGDETDVKSQSIKYFLQ